MPITELSYEDMKALATTDVCAVCGSHLTVAWLNGEYALRCAREVTHNTITRHYRKSGYEQIMEKEYRRVNKMDSTALTTMPESKMLERIGLAKFPQELTPADRKLLAQVAITYGFDPLMGEVSIYQGRPYVSIDGRYRKAQETGKLDGVQSRPASKKEREEWEIPEGDYFFKSEVYVKDTGHPFIGWGRVYQAETEGGKGFKPVEKNPQRMAEKRAEAQALRKAFHNPLPSVEDIGAPDADIDGTAHVIDTDTGEIAGVENLARPATVSGELTPTEALLAWVCEVRAYRTAKTAREWLTNVLKISEDRIQNDTEAIRKEVEQLLGK